jgi:nitrogen fixation/metabolism regulation signal transduction histidine kinase
LREKLDQGAVETASLRDLHLKAIAVAENTANESKKTAKEVAQNVRVLEQEREHLRGRFFVFFVFLFFLFLFQRLSECEGLLRAERARCEALAATAERCLFQ